MRPTSRGACAFRHARTRPAFLPAAGFRKSPGFGTAIMTLSASPSGLPCGTLAGHASAKSRSTNESYARSRPCPRPWCSVVCSARARNHRLFVRASAYFARRVGSPARAQTHGPGWHTATSADPCTRGLSKGTVSCSHDRGAERTLADWNSGAHRTGQQTYRRDVRPCAAGRCRRYASNSLERLRRAAAASVRTCGRELVGHTSRLARGRLFPRIAIGWIRLRNSSSSLVRTARWLIQ